MNKVSLTLKVDPELKKQFKAAAAANGEQMSGLVETWVRAYIQESEKEKRSK
jgi:antitoxin component of RelBE/YafQ-DinJ toxin-antitoxin module